MMRQSPALLAIALLLASVAGATPVPAPDAGRSDAPSLDAAASGGDPAQVRALQQSEAFTNVLTVDAARRANATQSRANLSAALTIRAEGLDRSITRRSVAAKLARMNDTDRKQRYIRHTVVELEIRAEELRTAERRAYELHSEGRISSRQLLIRLARIDREATALAENASVIGDAADDVGGLSVNSDLGVLRLELRTLRGPVRERVGEVLRGAAPSTRVYVRTGDEGVELAAVVGDRYVREVYDGTRRVENQNNRIAVDRIGDVLQDSYPLIYRRANGMFGTLQDQRQASPIFAAQMEYRTGSLVAYIDRGNAEVFREEQYVRLNRSPPTAPRTVTQSNLQLTVYPSYRGGPALIEVENARSGSPVRADVTFTEDDGSTQLVGRTDRQGRLWAVMPNGSVRIRAIHPDQTTKIASLVASPVDARQVRSDDDNLAANGSASGSGSVAGLASASITAPPLGRPS